MKTAKENFSERLLSQKRHPILQKLLSVLLCACLLLASLPMEGYGSEVQAEEPQRKILSFSELPDEVKYQTVEPGTPLEDLNLPKTLEAVCVPAGQDSNVNPETPVQPEESPDVKGTDPESGSRPEETLEVPEDMDETVPPEEMRDSSSGNENSEAEFPAENEAEEPETPAENGPEEQPESPAPDTEPGTGEVPEGNPETIPETDIDSNSNSNSEKTVVIEHVTWTGTPAYDSETEGVYVFAPVLPEGYVLAEGVGLPEVQVTVKSGDNSEGDGAGQETFSEGKKEESGTGEELTEEYVSGAEEREYGARAASDTIVISEDTEWDGKVLSGEKLVIEDNVTLTFKNKLIIRGTVYIQGGGTIKRGSNAAKIETYRFATLILQNIKLDGGGIPSAYPIIDVEIDSKLTIEDNCEIQNCIRNSSAGDGVIVLSANVTANFNGCVINGCSVKNNGGFLYLEGARGNIKGTVANFENCIIENCSAERSGGAFCCGKDSIVTLNENCRIKNCSAKYDGGGAIYSEDAALKLNGCVIEKCSARIGGAIYYSGRNTGSVNTLILDNGCKIQDCKADEGGAIDLSNYGEAEFNDCIIEKCSAGEGGAVKCNLESILTINGGSYSYNEAVDLNELRKYTHGGGFLYNREATVYIKGGDFIGNTTSGRGGAIYHSGYAYGSHQGATTCLDGGTFQGNSSSWEEYAGSGAIFISSEKSQLHETYFKISDNIKFSVDETKSGVDGIYLDSQNSVPRKVLVNGTLNYPVTVYLEAEKGYVIAEGTDDYHLTEEERDKISVVDVNGKEWYKKLDEERNLIYLMRDDTEEKFMIFYHDVDGKVTDNTKYSSGTSATIQSVDGLADPIPNQEKFLGWCENEDGTGKIYEGGETVMMTKDLHLYPVYKKKTLSADFYSGGPGPSEPRHEKQEVEEDVESVTITAPALQDFPDWTPLGWNENAEAYESTDTIAVGGECTLTEDGKKYYGVYQKEVTLTYDSADDIVTAEVIMPGAEKALRYANVHEAITYQDAVFPLPSGPEVPGYTFKGWSEQGDGSGELHEAGTKYSIQEDDTLYAVYEEKAKKTFTADFYSGSLRQLETVSKTEEEPTASTDITAPSLQAMEGWEAVGWERESPSLYNGDVKPNTTVTLEQEKTDFYGIYQKEVTLTYDSADKAVTADVTMPGEGKETCYANVHKDEITYKEADFILAEGPEVSGYIFQGWSEQESGGGTLHETGSSFSIQEDTTLYAVYKEKGKRTFIADFYSGNPLRIKSESDIRDEDATEGTVTVPSPENITDWTFLGWEEEDPSGYEGAVKPKETVTLEKDKTSYYGIYETDVTLTYNANGGDSTPPEDTQKRYANVHETIGYQDPDFTIAPAIHREGHTFVEWNTKADGSGNRYTAGSRESFTKDTTLYAVFLPKGQKQFNADFYSGGPNQKETIVNTVEDTVSGADITVPKIKEMAGWTALGWNKSKGAYTADPDIQPGRTVTLTEPLTEYYGIYEKDITLSYDSNGGGEAPAPEKKACYASVHQEITQKYPDFTIAGTIHREGHTFVGWNTEADGTGTSYEPGSTRKLEEDTLLYAVWRNSAAPEPSEPSGPSEPEPSGPDAPAPETAPYRVEYYCQNLTGEEYTRMDSDTELLTGTVGTEAEASRKTYTGFTLNLSHPSGKPKGTVERDGSLVLKLYYDRLIYEVDFSLNGGYGKAPDTQHIRYGGLLGQVSDPLRRGYNFKGWYMDDKGLDGGIWDFGSPVEQNTGTLKTTLYAKWADELAPAMGKASFSKGSRDFLDWLIQKESMVVTVPVTEEGSGLARAEYLLVAEDGTEQDGQAAFTELHTMTDTMAAYGSSAAVLRSIRGEAESGSYEARIAIEEEFKGKVYLTCTDYAGNVSAQKTLTAEGGGVIVEDNAPEIRFDGTKETAGGKPLEVKVEVRDSEEDRVTSGIFGVRYQVDKKKSVSLPEEDFTGDFAEVCEFTVKIKGEGKHILRVEAEDHAGNESAAEVTLNISGSREVPKEVPADQNPGNPGGHGKTGKPLGGEPQTGDSTHVQICATLAMIAGFGYLLLYFEGENGITEQEKEEMIHRIVTWAKQGGSIRKLLGLAGIFLFLAYYHSIGKSVDMEWKEVYGKI